MTLSKQNLLYGIPARPGDYHIDTTNIIEADDGFAFPDAVVIFNADVPFVTRHSVAWMQADSTVGKKTTLRLKDAERATCLTVLAPAVSVLDIGKYFSAMEASDMGEYFSAMEASDMVEFFSAGSASDMVEHFFAGAELEQLKRDSIRDKILEYSKIPENFDGYGGHAPDSKDITNACRFIKHIPATGIDTVRTMAAGDGDVGFDWDHEGHHLEVGFYEGAISFFGVMPGGEKLNGDVDFDENNIPEKLQRLMYAILRK